MERQLSSGALFREFLGAYLSTHGQSATSIPGCGSRYLDELSRVHRAGGKVRHGPACGGNCDCNWSLIERGHSAHGGDVSKVPCTDSIEGGPDIPLLKVVPPWPGGQGNKLDVVADFFCEILRTVSRSPTHRAKSRYNGLEGLKLVLAPGTGGHICELFAENSHWRKRLTELSRLYTDALDVAMERRGGTDD